MRYLVLNLVVIVVVAALCAPVLRRLAAGPILWTAAAVLAMTAVFDSMIVGYGLTVYEPGTYLGVLIGSAPIEDFAYTVVAVLLMPTLWTVLRRRSREPDGEAAAADAPAVPGRSRT